MARQVWVDPNNAAAKPVFVDSSISPQVPLGTPAPAGNPVVPAGYVQQVGQDGFRDSTTFDATQGIYVPMIRQFTVPYFSGGWPPDPLAGQPGHTALPARKDGIND